MLENSSSSKSVTGNNSFQADEYSYSERKPVWKIFLIIFVVLALVAAAVYMTYQKNPQLFTRNSNAKHANIAAADTNEVSEPKEIPAQKVEAAPANVVIDNPAVDNTKNKYHIIAGAFVVEKNASSFMQQLQKNGYDPKIVLKRNEYSFVSIFSYATFKEANAKCKTFDGTGMPVWIMKY